VDGLACPLHHPMTYSRQTREHSFLLGDTLSHHVAMGVGAFLGGVKPLDLDIRWRVNHLGTCVIKSYME
jgi:hypothetical protein